MIKLDINCNPNDQKTIRCEIWVLSKSMRVNVTIVKRFIYSTFICHQDLARAYWKTKNLRSIAIVLGLLCPIVRALCASEMLQGSFSPDTCVFAKNSGGRAERFLVSTSWTLPGNLWIAAFWGSGHINVPGTVSFLLLAQRRFKLSGNYDPAFWTQEPFLCSGHAGAAFITELHAHPRSCFQRIMRKVPSKPFWWPAPMYAQLRF